MDKFSLYSDSTLTNRYQTTIPEMVRKALRLKKRDKIRYILQSDGSVKIFRLGQDETDPVLTQFLTFLAMIGIVVLYDGLFSNGRTIRQSAWPVMN